MEKLKNDIISLMKGFNEKESKKLKIQQLLNLINKLDDQNIDDKELFAKIEELISNLRSIKSGHNSSKKIYNKSYYKLKQKIQKDYGIIAKGTYVEMSLAIGMTLGISIGAAFVSFSSVFISVGMIVGMTIGIAIGSTKEKDVEKEGKIY